MLWKSKLSFCAACNEEINSLFLFASKRNLKLFITVNKPFFFCEWRNHEHWNSYSGAIESHFIQPNNCLSNQLEVTEKHRVNSYSFVILASHVCRKKPRKFGSLHEHPQDIFDLVVLGP